MSEREIILDTETTGLHPNSGHKIVEIGALEMVDKVLTGNSFHSYLNPERDMPDEAYRIHGISSSFLADKPVFKDKASEFLNFIERGKLVIHNAAFDVKFLNHELSLIKLPSIELSEVIDTLEIAKKKFPGAKVNLNALCRRYKVDNSAREYHGALLDASLLAEVYIEMMGGRQSSFTMNTVSALNFNDPIEKNEVSGNHLIIYPTTEELTLHKNFMEKIFNK